MNRFCQSALASLAIGFSSLSAVFAQAASADDIDGVWRTEPRTNGSYITIRIAPCRGAPEKRCGTVAGAHEGARPDIVGAPILRDLQQESAKEWSMGQIIRPGTDKVYSSDVKVLGEDEIEVTGCVAAGLICLGQVWKRVDFAADRARSRDLR